MLGTGRNSTIVYGDALMEDALQFTLNKKVRISSPDQEEKENIISPEQVSWGKLGYRSM